MPLPLNDNDSNNKNNNNTESMLQRYGSIHKGSVESTQSHIQVISRAFVPEWRRNTSNQICNIYSVAASLYIETLLKERTKKKIRNPSVVL